MFRSQEIPRLCEDSLEGSEHLMQKMLQKIRLKIRSITEDKTFFQEKNISEKKEVLKLDHVSDSS